MSTREILTLQFGRYSNYVGAHFWNIQELSFDYTGTVKSEINHDILYREGQTYNGEITYTPRLLIADLKQSLKTLPVSGGLENNLDTVEELLWDSLVKIEDPPETKNEFLTDIESENPPGIENKKYILDQDVNTWTDYLYPRFHSRTLNIVQKYQHGNEQESFDIGCDGRVIWKSEYGEIFSDNIRKYVEECDSIQGFQVMFDCYDGFSGLALGCIEHLVEEYTKSIIAHPLIPSYFKDNDPVSLEDRDKSTLKDSMRLINIALSIEELSENVTFFVPLCTGEKGWRKPGPARKFEHLNYKSELYYHSSALLASAMDTLSQKYRHQSNFYSMSDICADLTGYGRKMAAASLGIPLSFHESEYLIDHLNNTTQPIYNSITPSCQIATDKIFQLITVRGIPEHYLKAPLKEAKQQINLPAYRCRDIKEIFELYFQANNFLSATNVTVCEKPLEVKSPFPNIFSEKLNRHGLVHDNIRSDNMLSCPIISGYHNGNFVANTIEKLHREVSRIKFSKLHKFQEVGLELTDFKENLNKLAEFKDNYEDDFEL